MLERLEALVAATAAEMRARLERRAGAVG
jgi:hypothetical protein